MNLTDQTALAELLEKNPEHDVFFNIINRFIGHYTRKSQQRSINDTSTEYPFVAMDTKQVFAQIKFTKEYLEARDSFPDKKFSFLDIGCGIGNVLLIAEQFDFEIFGLEKDDYPREIASSLLDTEQIYSTDIRQFNEYDKFDVLYYFCPLTDGQREFEKLIENSMKKGSILIANYKRDKGIEADKRFKRLHLQLPVWKKL